MPLATSAITLPHPRAKAVKWRPHDAADKRRACTGLKATMTTTPLEINAAAIKNGTADKLTPMMAQRVPL